MLEHPKQRQRQPQTAVIHHTTTVVVASAIAIASVIINLHTIPGLLVITTK